MRPTFLQLDAALRETHEAGFATIAHMAAAGASAQSIERFAGRNRLVGAAADALRELVPVEPTIRALADCQLLDFPEFSAHIGELLPGAIVLVRARVREVLGREASCTIAFATGRHSSAFHVDVADIVGVQRVAPSLWVPEPRR